MNISREEATTLLKAGKVDEWNKRRADGQLPDTLDRINLTGAKLIGVNFANVSLREAQLSGAQLDGASFINADLTFADLKDTKLREAKFDHCKITLAMFANADIHGANLNAAIYETGVTPPTTSSAPTPFAKLMVLQDYEKWHVGLYAGAIASTLLATALSKEPGATWLLVPTVLFLLAAACAGTLLGDMSLYESEDALDKAKLKILGKKLLKGAVVRVWEKRFFWLGVIVLLACVLVGKLNAKDTPEINYCVLLAPTASSSASASPPRGAAPVRSPSPAATPPTGNDPALGGAGALDHAGGAPLSGGARASAGRGGESF